MGSRAAAASLPDGIPIPNWQAGAANTFNGGSTTLRNVPDVKLSEADFDNYDCDMGTCQGTLGGYQLRSPALGGLYGAGEWASRSPWREYLWDSFNPILSTAIGEERCLRNSDLPPTSPVEKRSILVHRHFSMLSGLRSGDWMGKPGRTEPDRCFRAVDTNWISTLVFSEQSYNSAGSLRNDDHHLECHR